MTVMDSIKHNLTEKGLPGEEAQDLIGNIDSTREKMRMLNWAALKQHGATERGSFMAAICLLPLCL